MPAPKPWCGTRSRGGDVERGLRHRARVGAGRVREHLHDAARRDVQPVEVDVLDRLAGHPGDGRVDPHHLLDRVAGPSSGRSASSAHWSGCCSSVCSARPSWLRVVSMPANARKTSATDSSRSVRLLDLHQRGDQVLARVRAPVGDHLVDVRREPGRAPPRCAAPGGPRRWRTTRRGRRPSARPAATASSGSPRSRQMIRAAYGSANSEIELDLAARRELVDQLVRDALEGRRISAITRFLNAGTISRRIREWSSPSRLSRVSLPPLGERAVVDAVLLGPPRVALAEAAVPQQRAHLVVAQHRPAPRGLDVPVLLAGLVHERRGHVEGGVAQVEHATSLGLHHPRVEEGGEAGDAAGPKVSRESPWLQERADASRPRC